MAKQTGVTNKKTHESISKRTSQGGKIRSSSLNKSKKRSFKPYRGQGR